MRNFSVPILRVMFDEIEWRPTPGNRKEREGFCPDLPDSYCRFAVQKCGENDYEVHLPCIISSAIKLPFETYDEAKAFCARFLWKNKEAIIRHQVQSQQNFFSGYEAKRPLRYYENLLEGFVNERALKEVRKSPKTNLWTSSKKVS